MSGISSAIGVSTTVFPEDIVIDGDEYSVGRKKFAWAASEAEILSYTDGAIEVFHQIERAVNANPGRAITLTPEQCHAHLVELARWGRRAYQRIFSAEARALFARIVESRARRGQQPIAPTIMTSRILFPWEVLYQGEDYEQADPEQFWGLCYAPARVLDDRDPSEYVEFQPPPSSMLFCLHHKLREAHQREWPRIRELVTAVAHGAGLLLGPSSAPGDCRSGAKLVRYLYGANHTMLHFACHCRPSAAGGDALLLSLVQDQDDDPNPPVIELETLNFVDVSGRFACNPLVFLNACQSAGGADALRVTLHLPGMFVEKGAASVIATACPVPDTFAAEFARVFYAYFLTGRPDPAPDGQPMTVAAALRATRRYFLEVHHNPLGLAYGLYSPALYQLDLGPRIGGAG